MSIGVWEITLILLVVLIIFGAGKLPRVMGDVAKGITAFRRELKGTDPVPAPPPAADAPAPTEPSAPSDKTQPAPPATGA